jgi:hypothetical protein
MSQLENTSDMMSQLNASFGSTTSSSQNGTIAYPSHPTHVRRKTQSEDLSILAHAQGQLQSHLSAQTHPPIQCSDSTWHSQSQPPYLYPSHQAHQSQYNHALQVQVPRPHSSHQFSTTTYLDLRTPVTALPFRWWENGVLVSNSESEEEDIRPSIERDPAGSVVQSIEMPDAISPGTVGPRTDIKVEETDEDLNDDEMQEPGLWDEAQTWNGYVKHKESWVRRAGLKRVREEHEWNGAVTTPSKRGRA